MSKPITAKIDYQLEDLMNQTTKVDLNTIGWISNIYLSVQPLQNEPKYFPNTKFSCYIIDQTKTKVRLGDYITVPNSIVSNRISLPLGYGFIKKVFENIQDGKVSNISTLHLWAREGIFHHQKSSNVTYFIDPVLGDPGKKIKLSKDSSPGLACKNCDNYLLKYYDGQNHVDDFSQVNCPYCGKPLHTKERIRKYIRLTLTKNSPVTSVSYGFFRGLHFRTQLYGRDITMTFKGKKINEFFRNFQHLTGNKMGPFRIKLTYSWKKDLNLEDIEPMGLEDSEWHEAEIFPEDMLM